MRKRVPSLHEALFPVDLPEFEAIADLWPDDVVNEMLSLVWDGFEQMKELHFQRVDFSQPFEQLERSLTDLHLDEIQILWKQRSDGFKSFIPKHEAWEFHSRKNASSMPSSIDIGFVLIANRSLRWSVEAKVLERPADVSRYLADLTEKYLKGKGATLSATAALAGYLKKGTPNEVFPHLERRLDQKLNSTKSFPNKPHRTSRHKRSIPALDESTPFVCHHLILGLTN